jgi:hypothetical protein
MNVINFIENAEDLLKAVFPKHIWVSENGRGKYKDTYFNIFWNPHVIKPKRESMNNPDYYIDYSRCNTTEKLCDWIRQLSGKTWCTVEMINELIDEVNEVHKEKTGKVLF